MLQWSPYSYCYTIYVLLVFLLVGNCSYYWLTRNFVFEKKSFHSHVSLVNVYIMPSVFNVYFTYIILSLVQQSCELGKHYPHKYCRWEAETEWQNLDHLVSSWQTWDLTASLWLPLIQPALALKTHKHTCMSVNVHFVYILFVLSHFFWYYCLYWDSLTP